MNARIVLLGFLLFAGCDQDGTIYTLYRASPEFKEMRIHVATFDAADTENYNRTNCATAAGLFAGQTGVAVRYWCERGRYRR